MKWFGRHKNTNKEDEQQRQRLTVQDFLSGRIFSSPWFLEQRPLFYMIFFIMLVFAYSSYVGSIQQIRVKNLLEEVRNERYTMLDLSQEYNEETRATSISKTLREINSPVKEATTPPIRIK